MIAATCKDESHLRLEYPPSIQFASVADELHYSNSNIPKKACLDPRKVIFEA